MAGSITSRSILMNQLATGNGFLFPFSSTGASGTAAATASGYFSFALCANKNGTTYPTTLVGLPIPAPAKLRMVFGTFSSASSGRACYLCNAYQIGTVNLTATGSQLTHTTATLPMTRTVFGQGSTAIPLLPLILVTTATATTAPAFTMNYTNQDGGVVTGTKTFTFPGAATIAGSGYIIKTEDGDSGVQDISAISVVTAGTAGAATIYGLEFYEIVNTAFSSIASTCDSVFSGIGLMNMIPSSPTGGTITSLLTTLEITGANGYSGVYVGVSDT